MNDVFLSISQYIECKQTLYDKIVAINNLISAMELKLVEATTNTNYSEYQLDDGQMKVRTVYRSTKEVTDGILALEQLKQRYVNRYNGRVKVLRGGNL